MASTGRIWRQVGQNLQKEEFLLLFVYTLWIIISVVKLHGDGNLSGLLTIMLFSHLLGMEMGKHLMRAKIQVEKSV
jgi:hypothetical protein